MMRVDVISNYWGHICTRLFDRVSEQLIAKETMREFSFVSEWEPRDLCSAKPCRPTRLAL